MHGRTLYHWTPGRYLVEWRAPSVFRCWLVRDNHDFSPQFFNIRHFYLIICIVVLSPWDMISIIFILNFKISFLLQTTIAPRHNPSTLRGEPEQSKLSKIRTPTMRIQLEIRIEYKNLSRTANNFTSFPFAEFPLSPYHNFKLIYFQQSSWFFLTSPNLSKWGRK